ncbi:MAG: glycosyltransferase family 4 protein [Acidobacteria bacterium]|nr:glycosyltransferase family 4 protein [Acidobacteriota bacterium]
MKVLLVGNYEFDGSTSMRIWAATLLRELSRVGIDVRIISPRPLFGRLRPSASGVGKWLGYIDRFVVFPRKLRAAAAGTDIVHICDHGGAMYAPMIGAKPVVVTCHDMIAVQAARGELPQLRSSPLGKILQRWICHGLRRAARVACVSRATFDDAHRLLKSSKNLCVILNGLNDSYQFLARSEVNRRLARVPEIQTPFVLHLGSNLPYKNREGVLRIFAKVSREINLRLVIAGEALNGNLSWLASKLQIEERVVQVAKPDRALVEALYNRAVCLLFPSRYEGFGWPPIEAQVCGCPVVASNIAPFAEILGDTAILAPVEDEIGMADAIQRLASDQEFREQLRQRGFENVRARFLTSRMIADYVSLYRELIGEQGSRAARS